VTGASRRRRLLISRPRKNVKTAFKLRKSRLVGYAAARIPKRKASVSAIRVGIGRGELGRE